MTASPSGPRGLPLAAGVASGCSGSDFGVSAASGSTCPGASFCSTWRAENLP